MGILRKLLIIFAALYTLAGCSPLGHIYDQADHNALWAVPRRLVYNLGDDFVRSTDLWVFVSYFGGTMEPIDVNLVDISLITNRIGNDPIEIDEALSISSYVGAGRKLIQISYGNMTADYSIEVNDPFGFFEPGDGDNTGVIIEWN